MSRAGRLLATLMLAGGMAIAGTGVAHAATTGYGPPPPPQAPPPPHHVVAPRPITGATSAKTGKPFLGEELFAGGLVLVGGAGLGYSGLRRRARAAVSDV